MSIEIKNFNIAKDEIVNIDKGLSLSVDLVDYSNSVTCSGTYLYIDNSKVTHCFLPTTSGIITLSGIYTPILGGYNIKYKFYPKKSCVVRAVATNGVDSIEKEYILTFGYKVIYNKVKYFPTDYVLTFGINMVNDVTFKESSFFSASFRTYNFRHKYLKATISAAGSAYKDLICSITPQSMYFMYGRTYTVTISGVRDMNNNYMPTVKYIFTIEQKK